MGKINVDVEHNHLSQYPQEFDIISPFLSGFNISWASRKRAYNTNCSVYLIEPEPFMTEAYGFEFEIMLVYSPYNNIEPRAIQAAEQFLSESPIKGRADSVNYFLISDDPDSVEWVKSYVSSRQESRIIVTFSTQELSANKGDAWFIRNKLNSQFYGRDLFAYTLPLTEDTYFFGRQQIIASLLDAVKLSENRGVFGLRKTGKTSLLFKVKRIISQEKIGHVFFYDCKTPSLRKLHWNQLLAEICRNIVKRCSLNVGVVESEIQVVKTFKHIISTLAKRGVKIVLVFDEIEYISFKSIQDVHWHTEFLDFWQTMWSCQTIYKNLVFILAGVNPSVVETDTVSGVQNPLFGIVPSVFLKGFEEEEVKNLVRTLGKRMGMKFTLEANHFLFNKYGGHPLLTRLACSWLNKYFLIHKIPKPVELLESVLLQTQDDRDSDLTFYCKHIVSELKDFYPDEYEMLELLSSGQVHDFVQLSAYPEFVRHLNNYGLLTSKYEGEPRLTIPVVARYVGIELAKKEGRKSIYKLVPNERRVEWLEIRKENIIKDIKMFEKVIKLNNKPLLFGQNSFPEGEEFIQIRVVSNKQEFQNFINTVNRCFVESIENYGKSIGDRNYFWQTIKTEYAALFFSLNRIKVYRNDSDHIELNRNVSQQLLDYLNRDLEERRPSECQDLYFHLQQRTIDSLLAAINSELNKLN